MSLTFDVSDGGMAAERDQSFQENAGLVSGGFAEAAEFYRQLGFDSGYARAVADQLEFSVAAAEQILHDHADSVHGPADARRLLYAFIALMDRKLDLLAESTAPKCNTHFMEGGLGI